MKNLRSSSMCLTEIFPRTAKERWFVKLAFGANYISDHVYYNIKIPE